MVQESRGRRRQWLAHLHNLAGGLHHSQQAPSSLPGMRHGIITMLRHTTLTGVPC
jgi:hypothetical protein